MRLKRLAGATLTGDSDQRSGGGRHRRSPAAPQSGSQQKVVAPTAAYAALTCILSHGGTNWPAWATRFLRGA